MQFFYKILAAIVLSWIGYAAISESIGISYGDPVQRTVSSRSRGVISQYNDTYGFFDVLYDLFGIGIGLMLFFVAFRILFISNED